MSATSGKYISGVTLDGFGHVTGLSTATDKDTTYTFANGTNQFTVTPSGGSAQTVKVTPSLTVSAGATDDDVVILSGTSGTNGVSYSASHAQKGPSAGYTSGNSTTSISGYGDSKTIKIPQITVDKYGRVTAVSDGALLDADALYCFCNCSRVRLAISALPLSLILRIINLLIFFTSANQLIVISNPNNLTII